MNGFFVQNLSFPGRSHVDSLFTSEEQKTGCLVTCSMFLSCIHVGLAGWWRHCWARLEMAALTIVFSAIYIRLFATRRMRNGEESYGVGIFLCLQILLLLLLLTVIIAFLSTFPLRLLWLVFPLRAINPFHPDTLLHWFFCQFLLNSTVSQLRPWIFSVSLLLQPGFFRVRSRWTVMGLVARAATNSAAF